MVGTNLRVLQTNLGEPNKAEAEAVDARQELDLKVRIYNVMREYPKAQSLRMKDLNTTQESKATFIARV